MNRRSYLDSNLYFSSVGDPLLPEMDYSAVEEHADGSPWATSPGSETTAFDPTSVPFHDEEHAHAVTEQPFASERSHLDRESVPVVQQPVPPSRRQQQTEQPVQKPQPAKPRKEKPQYKLQAKVTGLERNGRKDPIVRFDVYVSNLS
jgi:hypothetical protein